MSDVWVAEITAYDASIAGMRVLRYASGLGFTTGPADAPPHTLYAGRLKQPLDLQRAAFSAQRTAGEIDIGYGELTLNNADGALDALKDYGFDGRQLVLYWGQQGATFPGGFTKHVFTMDTVEVTIEEVIVRVRDRLLATDIPLQPTKFAGTNVLPSGLEGGADLAGKPKPIVLGTVRNIAMVCVNTAKLIYQVHDAAAASVDCVYDKGLPLIGWDWSAKTTGFGTNTISGIAYGAGTWVAVGAGPTIQTSTDDGATWTTRTSPVGATWLVDVCYGNGIFVAANNGSGIAYSTDGAVTWSYNAAGFGGSATLGVCYAADLGLFIAVGASGKISTSPDGATWTAQTTGTTAAFQKVAYGNGVIVAVGPGTACYYSTDSGVTWYSATTLSNGISYSGIAFGAGRFVAVGYANVSIGGASHVQMQAIASNDGQLWTQSTSCTVLDARPFTISYGPYFVVSAYVSGATDGIALLSIDGGYSFRQVLKTTGNELIASGSNGSSKMAVGGQNGTLYMTSGIASYASQADLLDDSKAPKPGQAKAWLNTAGTYVRLGSMPAGQPTADVTEGATSADRTTAQVWKRLLTRLGFTSSDYSAADITALDTAAAGVVGFFTADETTLRATLSAVAASVGAWWGPDRTGVYRLKQLTAPSGTAVIALTANDSVTPPRRVVTKDLGGGLPFWRSLLRYCRNYTTQTDLAGAVTADRKADLANEWRSVKAEDATVVTTHLLAPQTDEESLLYTASDATTEVARRQTLRGVQRDLIEVDVPLNASTIAVDLGDVARYTHPRFGLAAGKLFRVLGIQSDGVRRRLTFTLWG